MNTVFTAKGPIATNGNGNGNGHSKATNSIKESLNNVQRDVVEALLTVGSHGSVEIYIQDFCVTQITARAIKKTKHSIRNTA